MVPYLIQVYYMSMVSPSQRTPMIWYGTYIIAHLTISIYVR